MLLHVDRKITTAKFILIKIQKVITKYFYSHRSRGSSVSTVPNYGLDDKAIEVRSSAEAEGIFPLSSVSRPALGPTQPPVQWVPRVLSPEGKARPGNNADHSPPSSAEVDE
jgi:hypothetical protein